MDASDADMSDDDFDYDDDDLDDQEYHDDDVGFADHPPPMGMAVDRARVESFFNGLRGLCLWT